MKTISGKFKTCIGENEIDVTVEYEIYTGCKGSTDRYGVPLEPNEEPECEIASITDNEGNEVEVSDKVIESLMEESFENASEKVEAYKEMHLSDLRSF